MIPEIFLDDTWVSRFREWEADRRPDKLGFREFVRHASSPLEAEAILKLIEPGFVEFGPYIILEDHFDPDGIATWEKELGEDRRSIELLINHVHIYDVIDFESQDPSVSHLYEFFAKQAIEHWRKRLIARFPHNRFTFTYATEPDEYGPTISFCQSPRTDMSGDGS